MVKINLTYQGGLRCEATHMPSGMVVQTDAPVDNHGKGEHFSPTDLVATALGSCMATIIGILADRKGWNLEGMRISVTKEMTTTPPRRIARLTTEIWMPIALDAESRAQVERAAYTCPVHQSLHPDVQIPVTFHWPA